MLFTKYPVEQNEYYKKWNDVSMKYQMELAQLQRNMTAKYDNWKQYYDE